MKKIRKAVIPIAGMGTRFLPATKSIPKEMLPIVDIPTIEYIVREAVDSGIEEILFITSPYKNSVLDHFDHNFELETRLLKNNKKELYDKVVNLSKLVKIVSIRQGEPLGTGHAISLARSFVGNEPFVVMYGDNIIKGKPALRDLIEVYEKYDCNVIGTYDVAREEVNKYGIIEFYEGTSKIKRIVEKPHIDEAPSCKAGMGRYLLKPEIFDELAKIKPCSNGEYLLTDAMEELMKSQDFYAATFTGEFFDIGNQLGYLKANVIYGLDRIDLKDDLLNFIRQLIDR